MRQKAKTDGNHQQIIDALRAIGVSVFSTHKVGKGFPDLVCGYRGKNYLIEIKDGNLSPSRRQLTPDDVEFHRQWAGKIHVVNNVEDALKVFIN